MLKLMCEIMLCLDSEAMLGFDNIGHTFLVLSTSLALPLVMTAVLRHVPDYFLARTTTTALPRNSYLSRS